MTAFALCQPPGGGPDVAVAEALVFGVLKSSGPAWSGGGVEGHFECKAGVGSVCAVLGYSMKVSQKVFGACFS